MRSQLKGPLQTCSRSCQSSFPHWLFAGDLPQHSPSGALHRAAPHTAASSLRSDTLSLLPYAVGYTDLALVQWGGDCTRVWTPGGGGHWEPSLRLLPQAELEHFVSAFLRTSQMGVAQFIWPLVYLGIIFSMYFFIDVMEFKSKHFLQFHIRHFSGCSSWLFERKMSIPYN